MTKYSSVLTQVVVGVDVNCIREIRDISCKLLVFGGLGGVWRAWFEFGTAYA